MTWTARVTSLFAVQSANGRYLFATCWIVAGLSALVAQPSAAALYTLTDDNSVARFDTGSQAGAYDWLVDGTDHLTQQAFWYRVGNTAEASLDTLPRPTEGTSDGNFDGNPDHLFVRYAGAGFTIEITYGLDGGSLGSGASHVSEQISIKNLTAAPLDFHFFQYSDFDLMNTTGNDGLVFTNPNAVQQFDSNLAMTETVITPVASHREGGFFPTTLAKLNDASPTTLNDAPPFNFPLGPGDMTWAYQWDFSIAPNGTKVISKAKQIAVVPEPGSALLIGLGAMALLGIQVRRRTS